MENLEHKQNILGSLKRNSDTTYTQCQKCAKS